MKAIATYVGTRNATQVRTHAQKYFLRLVSKNDFLLHIGGLPMRSLVVFLLMIFFASNTIGTRKKAK